VNGKVWVPHYKCILFGSQCEELAYSVHPQFNGSDTVLYFSLAASNQAGNSESFVITSIEAGSYIKGIGNNSD
jgi:hypothetical protein